MTTVNFIPTTKYRPRILRYRLLCLRRSGEDRVYCIQVKLGKEQCTGQLPCQSREYALELYKMIRRGKVTPCTLKDILEDMK